MSSSPPEFVVRHPCLGDAEAVHALIASIEEHFGEEIGFGLDDLLDSWRRLDLEHDAWLWEQDGDVAAYASVRTFGTELGADGYVGPGFLGRGLGGAIVETTEGRARERGAPKLGNAILAADGAAALLLEAHGYRDVRHYFRMTIEMDEPPQAPEWPEGLVPRPFEPEHALAFHAADDEAFEDERGHSTEPFEEFVERRLEHPRFDPELWTAVWDGDEIAATLIADWKRLGAGWIGGLGVRRPWRRRGLGRALLLRSFGEFYERGERRVSLSVDSESPTGATRLYERAGMYVAWEAVLYEKQLDQGRRTSERAP
jgi:GNAT superfamily N-acetyltransferase